MKIYLKNESQQRLLTIELLEGHTPVVVDLSLYTSDVSSITDSLEPAIWFKVMILETINIDCCNRMVAWADGVKDKEGNPVTNVVYGEDRSCYDFDDDIDELFKIANFLIENSPCSQSSSEESVRAQAREYERSVIRLLHCYILNKIVFTPSDIERMRTALTSQRKAISQLDDTALVHTRTAEHYSAQLRTIRENEVLPLLEEFMRQKEVNSDFIQALKKDLTRLENILRRDFDHLQEKVDLLKAQQAEAQSKEPSTSTSPSPQLSHDLDTARQYRTDAFQRLECHLVAKELCRTWNPVNYDGGGGEGDWCYGGEDEGYDNAVYHDNEVVLNEHCARYLTLHKRVRAEKDLANLAITKKLRAASVRECMESVIKDLEKGVDSTGDDVTKDGQRVTDVMAHLHSAPEWQTLTQRLSSIVYNHDHPIGIAFHDFCINLQANYQEIALMNVENNACSTEYLAPTYGDFYIVSEKDYGLNRNFLENQRNLICSHVYQITELFAEVFGNYWDMFVRKVRLCYEKCLYNQIGRDLIAMYRLVHAKPMQELQRNIVKLKTLKIAQLQLQMKWEWWLEMFAPEKMVTEVLAPQSEIEVPRISVDDIDGSPCNSGNRLKDHGYLSDMDPDNNDSVAFLTDIGEEEICDKSFGSSQVVYFGRSLSAESSLTNGERGGGVTRSHSVSSITSVTEQTNSVLVNGIYVNGQSDQVDGVRTIPLNDDNSSSVLGHCKKMKDIPIVKFTSSSKVEDEKPQESLRPGDTITAHFGSALQSIRSVFSNPSPLKKMQCLTAALRMISKKVEDLRMREHDDVTKVKREKVMVTAEDLLPLLVLILLQLRPEEVGKLYVELLFVSDMMAEFLSSGCHSFALCEFQIAFRVIEQTCDELSAS